MFDIGFWEIILTFIVALVVFGPERLPKAVRSFQRFRKKISQFGQGLQAELSHELRIKELHDDLKKFEAAADPSTLSPELQRSYAELKAAAAFVNQPYKNGQYAPAQLQEPETQEQTVQKLEQVEQQDGKHHG